MKELRYSISSWQQATECLSNNSVDLYITVSSLLGSTVEGQLIAVNHRMYGILFAAMTYGDGTIITRTSQEGEDIHWMTTNEILKQLEKFGFLIEYSPEEHLPGDQISYLMTLYNLGFQHITTIRVQERKVTNVYVIAFNGDEEPEWLQWPSGTSKALLDTKVAAGKVLNVSALTEKENFNWDWLTYVANIPDVLRDNAMN